MSARLLVAECLAALVERAQGGFFISQVTQEWRHNAVAPIHDVARMMLSWSDVRGEGIDGAQDGTVPLAKLRRTDGTPGVDGLKERAELAFFELRVGLHGRSQIGELHAKGRMADPARGWQRFTDEAFDPRAKTRVLREHVGAHLRKRQGHASEQEQSAHHRWTG